MHIKVSAKQAEKAVAVLAEKVYNPVFFSKLAEFGVRVNSAQEAEQLLKLAYDLRERAIRSFGPAVLQTSAEPAYVDAARQFVNENAQVKAAALVFHSMNKQGGV